jgi:hypothetical protein
MQGFAQSLLAIGLSDHQASWPCTVTLPPSSRSTLQELTVIVELSLHSSLHVINELRTLRTLELHYDGDKNITTMITHSPTFLKLPRLDLFIFIRPNPWPDLDTCLDFLVGCQFPPTCMLCIVVPDLDASRSLRLNPLFDSLATSQYVTPNSAGVSPYSSIFAHANIVHFGSCIPPLELFKHGARLLGKIHLPLMSTPKHVCWELLDYLIEQRSDSGVDTSNLPSLRLAIGNIKENPPVLMELGAGDIA